MPKIEQPTQLRNSRTYLDTQTPGSGMETPGASDQHGEWDLNNLRTQIAKILDPVTPAKWYQDMAAAGYDNFGIKQIHDKKFVFMSPYAAGVMDFVIGLQEIHSVDTVADVTDSLDGTFWVFYETPTNAFYVWYDTPAGAGDPAPTPPGGVTYTGIQVSIIQNETADQVAAKTKTAIDGSVAEVTTVVSTNQMTITNDRPLDVTDVADGSAATGFTFGTDQQGTGTAAGGVLVDSGMVNLAPKIIGVGASSTAEGGYVAADEANFTVAGTLGVGTSQALDSEGILLNTVDVFDADTNDPVETAGNETVFGLLQTVTGTSDGASIAGPGSENLQISFVYIDSATDTITAHSLAAGNYHFNLPRQRCFYSLSRGAMLSGIENLPDQISPGATIPRLPWREIDITSAVVAANDPLTIATAVFNTAGAQSIFGSHDTPALPTTGAQFRDDSRVKVWRNGNLQSKGADASDDRDCYWISETQLAFETVVNINEIIMIESPASF